jgi:hypothetical protein
MENMLYLPHLSQGRIVRAFRFECAGADPLWCVLLTDCVSPTPVRYAHVMVVHRGATFLTTPPSFAVSSEVNKTAAPDSGRSHFLCVFPGQGGPQHENLGGSDDWADLGKFEERALALIAQRLGLATAPQAMDVTEKVAAGYRLPRTYMVGSHEPPAPPQAPRKWWQFWRK